MSMSTKDIQIICDGKKVVVLHKNTEGDDVAYIINNPLISDISFDFRGDVDLTMFGSKPLCKVQPEIKFDISFITSRKDLMMESGKDLFFNNSVFASYTISELFKIINKKINARGY
jgi:hypothetical protein